MSDRVDQQTRSRVMGAIRSVNSKPEILLRKQLYADGVRGWRLHSASVPGKPDLVFSRGRLAVFVDGCFWHGCPKCYRQPRSNVEYWTQKLRHNRLRDAAVDDALASQGWTVLRLWEHEVLSDPAAAARIVELALERPEEA